MHEMKVYLPLAKVDREQRMVYGYASTEALDSQGEVVRRQALAAALPEYMRFANIREMHQPSAVGVAKEAAIDEKGLWLGAKVIDDEAWKKVVEGVYKGFSIGGFVTSRDPRDPTVITGIDLAEISLVDRPANPEARVELFKSAAVSAPGTRRWTSRASRASTTWRRRLAPIAQVPPPMTATTRSMPTIKTSPIRARRPSRADGAG